MVIHTLINEYDLLYAQESEMNFVEKGISPIPFSTELVSKGTELTCTTSKLDILKGITSCQF